MKRALSILGALVALVVVVVGGFVGYVSIRGIPTYPPGQVQLKVEVTPERVARGKKFAMLLCAGCHTDPKTLQLTGAQMLDAPEEFGPIVSLNITQDKVHGIGSWTDGEILYLLRTGIGRDGRYIPPYMAKLPHMADEDLHSIIAFLRSDDPMVAARAQEPSMRTQPSLLTKVLSHTMFKPLPYPKAPIKAPDPASKLDYGRYLVINLDCWPCHSEDFKTMNAMEPERTPGFLGGGNPLLDLGKRTVRSANLTSDAATGIGRWSEADFIRAMHHGVRPDGRPILYPMGITPELSEADLSAMFSYLRSVPAISNAVERAVPPVPGNADVGKKAYYQYGCYGCHGDNGGGIADLRHSRKNFPTDEQLIAWIKNAPSIKPGVHMPKWEGVIPEDQFAPLAAYVRSLGDAR